MEIIYKNIKDLQEYANNPRHNDEAVAAVANSIKEFGFKVPIVIDKNNVIVAGHTRLKAAKKLNLETVPVIIADDLSDEQVKAFRLADNKVGELAQWNFEMLELELLELDGLNLDFEMSDFGFDEFKEEEPEVVEDDFDEENENIKQRAKLGDIWKLGNHRLICGDSTDALTIDLLMDGQKADLVFTDPPYGMKKEADGVLNDNLNFDKLLEFNKQWIPLTFEALKDNGSWYCWGIDEPLMDIYSEILKPMKKNKGGKCVTFRNLITWDKGSGQGQLSDEFRMYPIADEKCLFVMCGEESAQSFSVNQEDYSESMDKVRLYLESEIAKLNQNDKTIANALGYKDGRTVNHWRSKSQFALPTRENYEALREYGKSVLKDYDFLKKDYDELKKDYDELKKDFYESRAFFDNTHDNMNNVWKFKRTSGEEREQTGGHVTPKPLALCERAIKSSSRKGEIVLDVFGGSGSTLIACEQLERVCYMAEMTPHYCDVIIQRFENLTGKKAELL